MGALKRLVLAIGALFTLCGGGAAQTPSPTPIICPEAPAAREAEDEAIVQRALDAYSRRGFSALTPHVPALEIVLANAPACYPALEQRGDVFLLRAINPRNAARLLRRSNGAEKGGRRIEQRLSIYPLAALLLGSHSVEHGDFARGLDQLNRGLALQPEEPVLLFERAAALNGLRRYDEVAASMQTMLGGEIAAFDRARALRVLGIALIDLNRLDDAEAALNQSIALEPNNPSARNELIYIQNLRRGAPPKPLEVAPLEPNSRRQS